MSNETKRKPVQERPLEEQPEAAQRRRGDRRSAGADTPAGTQTNRSVKRAKDEILRNEGRDDVETHIKLSTQKAREE